jgi:hypothetical protein
LIGVIGLVVSFGAMFKRPIECGYPINYYLKTTNIGGSSVIDNEGCLSKSGLWYNTFTREEYTKVHDLRVLRYIPRNWVVERDQHTPAKTLVDINEDTDNLYTIGKNDVELVPFKNPSLTNQTTCIYYTQLDRLFTKYKLQHLENESVYINTLLKSCDAAKIRGDISPRILVLTYTTANQIQM